MNVRDHCDMTVKQMLLMVVAARALVVVVVAQQLFSSRPLTSAIQVRWKLDFVMMMQKE